MRKKEIPDILVRSVMSLYEGAKIRVRVNSELSEELEVKVGMHQGSVLSPFILAVVVDVVTEFARECALSELLYADDLVLMSETIERHGNKFLKWKDAFESKGLKAKFWKTLIFPKFSKVTASQWMTCQKVKLIHVRSATLKRVTAGEICNNHC